jgi:hypothetical protein
VPGLDSTVHLHRVKGERAAEGRGTLNWTIGYDTIYCIAIQWCPERSKSAGGGLAIFKFIDCPEFVDSGVRRSDVELGRNARSIVDLKAKSRYRMFL